MKQLIKLSLLLMLSLFIIAGCSDQEGGEDDSDSENSSRKNDTHVEHQEGLEIGETGIVEDNNRKYEITLNSVEYVDSVGGLEPNGETFVEANITVKNIDDDSFNASNIYEPGFGPEYELQASQNPIFMDADNVEQDLLEGEIAPGETVSGDHVFEIEEIVDEYKFAIGGKGVQIRTYAQWEVSESEIK
ncbi:hypothetical protein J2Z83_000735 [Virgibacillus natechei]|uniref:DUF4352 domain-containing protein n=1 Tax=Virgibacillus natechei TaxID=1216297 RepID=A0ABS4ICH2_9BACI|nr:DUF4352 domain-containing protein [Virgibacillus natechei]MBP1968643.1 hypothetical protein [Virgibacillus natechei]UZD13748.1 DUF4352 domain-containing protein [Virgibacillus natechei]